jgi:hypothetical protein
MEGWIIYFLPFVYEFANKVIFSTISSVRFLFRDWLFAVKGVGLENEL